MRKRIEKGLTLCLAAFLITVATVAGTMALETLSTGENPMSEADAFAAEGGHTIGVELLRQRSDGAGGYTDMTEHTVLVPLAEGYTENVIRVQNTGNVDSFNRVLMAVPTELAGALALVQGDDWELTETLMNQVCEDGSYDIYVYTMKGDLAAGEISTPAILGVRLKDGGEVVGERYVLNGKTYDFSEGVGLLVRAQTVQSAFLQTPENAFKKVGMSGNPWAKPLPNAPVEKDDLKNVLATLPTGTEIRASVTDVVFGRREDYPEIATTCYGQLLDMDNPNGPTAYYKAGKDAGGNTTWTIYILSDEVVYLPANCESLFKDMANLTTVDTTFLDTSHVTNMHSMFQGCTKLETVDVSKWNTSKVTTMSQMFYHCPAVNHLDVSEWDTSSVTGMSQMFNGCESLEYLDTSKWNMSKVTGSYSYMFTNCKKLTAVDVAGWVTKDTKSISFMFLNCNKLEAIDVSGWDTSNVTAMDNAFNGCSSVKELDVSMWDTSKVTTTWQMFQNCSQLKDLNLTGWNTSNVTSMANMFNGCRGLTELDLASFDVKKVTKATTMFNNCSALTTVYVSADAGWDALAESHAEEVMFASCSKLAGGAGTTFKTQNGIYARIDGGTENPGYFTEKVKN